MKVGITGASGMLGTALIDKLAGQHKVFSTARSQGIEEKHTQWKCFDLTDLQQLDDWLTEMKPDVVVHCAAIVNVDKCEENKKSSFQLHVDATEVIANYLDKNNGQLIYISTDSVFGGNNKEPYIEKDEVDPLNTYASTKLLGEKLVLTMKRGLVVRTNIIGWSRADEISFAEWILKGLVEQKPLTLFSDVLFSPLHVSDLSMIIIQAIEKKAYGLYHASSRDSLSKYDFGVMMADVFGFTTENISAISVDDLKLKAKRPKNMALSNKKITNFLQYDLPIAREAVKLMKKQYDNGWLSRIKGRKVVSNYEFWKVE